MRSGPTYAASLCGRRYAAACCGLLCASTDASTDHSELMGVFLLRCARRLRRLPGAA